MTEQKKQQTIRPTKRQKEMLGFIEEFIVARGYSPSYREIMKGLNYNSVATVAAHVNNLIRRGHLQKRDYSARSLEVVKLVAAKTPEITPKQLDVAEEKWLVEKVNLFFKEAEQSERPAEKALDQLYVLVGALKVLGLEGAAQSYIARLSVLKKKQKSRSYSA